MQVAEEDSDVKTVCLFDRSSAAAYSLAVAQRRQAASCRKCSVLASWHYFAFAFNRSFIPLSETPVLEVRPLMAMTLRFNFPAMSVVDFPPSRRVRSRSSSSAVQVLFTRRRVIGHRPVSVREGTMY